MLCIANNISLHLAGCKKVQQVLAKPGQLELFVHSESELAQLRDVFAGLYTLDKNELR
jgi:adenylylsulfate kinase-like enzyme